MPMIIDEITSHPRVEYLAKDFDSQQGYRFKIDLGNSTYIETGIYLHWKYSQPVDIAIDLSCMSGCSQHCQFCAAANSKTSVILTSEQIVEQAEIALTHIAGPCEEFFNSDKKKITFSFEGIGEPSDCYTNVADAIQSLRRKYENDYNVQFIISTILADTEALTYWADPEIGLQSLQISLHSAIDETRKKLLGNPRRYKSIKDVFGALAKFTEASPATEIKINYLLIANVNDSEKQREALLELMKPTEYYLKLSSLNETGPSKRFNLQRTSNKEFQSFYRKCKDEYGPTYIYGSFNPIGISCGQLASYAEERRFPLEYDNLIRDVYDEILEENMVLFIGAGASTTVWNSTDLARILYRELKYRTPFEQTRLSLQDIAEIYEARGKRSEIDQRIKVRLTSAPYPQEFLELTKFPWRAIYTTNYDQFIERAYEDAYTNGLTNKKCFPIRDTLEICAPSSNDAIPLVKLHGCISKGVRNRVIAERDYLDGYIDEREYLFKMFEVDCLRHSVLFAGYSFRDQYLSQKLFDLSKRVEKVKGPSYAVIRDHEMTPDYQNIFREKYNIKLIPCEFRNLILELSRLSKSLVVLVSGSQKAAIGGREVRADYGTAITELCHLLGRHFDQEGIRLVTGATAKDKIGYLVGSSMDNRSLVTTYIWEGVRDFNRNEIGDEIDEMINVEYYGSRAEDIIDKTIRVCNAVIFIGGSGMSLEEFNRANSANKLIIPVSLGNNGYASDTIHAFYSLNLKRMEQFSSDLGYKEKKRSPHNFTEFITRKRLEKLDLSKNQPQEVADVIIEILRHFRVLNLAIGSI